MIIYWLSSCTSIKSQYADTSLNEPNTGYTIGQIETVELKLAREVCIRGMYSPCDGGWDLPFRSYPAFVKLNPEGFINSYNDTVYLLADPIVYDTLRKRGTKCMATWLLDSLPLGKITEYNTINYYVPGFKKKVRRIIKRQKFNIYFNGYISYALFKMKFQRVYGGKFVLILPALDKKSKDMSMTKICDVFFITDIESIQPIDKEAYFK